MTFSDRKRDFRYISTANLYKNLRYFRIDNSSPTQINPPKKKIHPQ